MINDRQKTGEWIPCSDRRPKQYESVIACIGYGMVGEMVYFDDCFYKNGVLYNISDNAITAWMPMPEPYTDEKKYPMDIQEAIKRIKKMGDKYRIQECYSDYECRKCSEAVNIAISAIKENQQYLQIGTIEECREAREKQIPKNPVYSLMPYSKDVGFQDELLCPYCDNHVGYVKYSTEGMSESEQMEYCNNCGQKLLKIGVITNIPFLNRVSGWKGEI